jgi:predicted ArsR family transcriptional regulator
VDNSRQRILGYIQAYRSASVLELSRVLHVTPANIRHHLDILLEQGVVLVVSQRLARGRGRPARIYGLTQQFSSHNLSRLASALLHEHLADQPPGQSQEAIARLAERILGEAVPASHVGGGSSLSVLLLHAVQVMNEMNYQARWEAHPGAPRVIFQHCPYLAILPEHPELCQLDVRLLENMLHREVVLTDRLVSDAAGQRHCAFITH